MGLFLFLLTQILLQINGHPQCLDFKPPFQSERTLEFCSQYSTFGCCTYEDDQSLFQQFQSLKSSVSQTTVTACESRLREVLCLKCSPYAAHIYEAENSLVPKPFPGLCDTYCRSFFLQCRELIPFLTPEDLTNLNTSTFCNQIQLSDKDYCFPNLLSNDVLNNQVTVQSVTKPGCLCVEEVAGGLRNPVFAINANDRSNRLFVGEVIGMVWIYYPNGSRINQPFLDLRNSTLNSKSDGDERGFLGMTFHPNYRNNGKFYIYYSVQGSSWAGRHAIRISEMLVSATNRDIADISSERILFQVDEPYWNHNGGEILFGDDNLLYIFVGDGGAAGDPDYNAQNLSVPLGKVLRIDVDNYFPDYNYGIPNDNPFLDVPGALPEIYAYGVRNIWRCGKDRGDPNTGEGKGRVICGDVGQNAEEELDLLIKGANYGWNIFEGMSCFTAGVCDIVPEHDLPIHTYPHSVGKSITGGKFYRGCHSPNLNGLYIFGDFMSGKLFQLTENKQSGQWESKEIFICEENMCTYPLQSTYEAKIISFGEDEDGEVYILSTKKASSGSNTGKMYRIIDPWRRGNPLNCPSAISRIFERVRKIDITQSPLKTTTNTRRKESRPRISIKIRRKMREKMRNLRKRQRRQHRQRKHQNKVSKQNKATTVSLQQRPLFRPTTSTSAHEHFNPMTGQHQAHVQHGPRFFTTTANYWGFSWWDIQKKQLPTINRRKETNLYDVSTAITTPSYVTTTPHFYVATGKAKRNQKNSSHWSYYLDRFFGSFI